MSGSLANPSTPQGVGTWAAGCHRRGAEMHQGVPLRLGREIAGHHLRLVPSVQTEIRPINRPDATIGVQLGHADQAGVGQVHRTVGVFGGESLHGTDLAGEVEVQNQIAASQEREHGDRSRIETAGLRDDCVTGQHGSSEDSRGKAQR